MTQAAAEVAVLRAVLRSPLTPEQRAALLAELRREGVLR